MKKYWIIEFSNNKYGQNIRKTLLESPNGTSINISPIHINNNRDIWVTLLTNKEVSLLSTWKGIKSIYETTIDYIEIPSHVISRQDITFNKILTNIFYPFAPHLNWT